MTIPTWTLADRLRKSREFAGLEQNDVADYLGMSRGAISDWERDVRKPKLGVLRLWSEVCHVPLEWLRGSEDEPGGGLMAVPDDGESNVTSLCFSSGYRANGWGSRNLHQGSQKTLVTRRRAA